jgi:hypothetical protein
MTNEIYLIGNPKESNYSQILQDVSANLVKSKIKPVINVHNLAHIVSTYDNGDFVWPCLIYNTGYLKTYKKWNHLLSDLIVRLDPDLAQLKNRLPSSLEMFCDPEEEFYYLETSAFQLCEYLCDNGFPLSAEIQENLTKDRSMTSTYITHLLKGFIDPSKNVDTLSGSIIKDLATEIEKTPWISQAIALLEHKVPNRVLLSDVQN